MINKISKIATVALLTALMSMAANATPVLNTDNGLYYEAFFAPGITWDAANSAANLKSFMGVQGHLATINTEAEDIFVHLLVPGGSEHWVGAFQDLTLCGTTPLAPEPGCGWQWVNGELISATNTASPYTNWLSGEPNDNYGLNSENHAAINLKTIRGLNDEGGPGLGNIDGYIVEYGDALIASNCVGASCPLGGGSQGTTVPEGTPVEDDDMITFTLEVRCDPRVNPDTGRCDDPANRMEWDIFGDRSRVLPDHIYATHCIAVMPVDATFEIPSGLVEHIQSPELVPGIDLVFDCDATLPLPHGGPDLQGQLLFAWEPDAPIVTPEGAPMEMTTSELCSSSRGATFSLSTFYLNTHFDFCLDGDPVTGDPAAVLDEFIVVVNNKFNALFETHLNSKDSWASSKAWSKAKSKLNQARSLFKKGQFDKSLTRSIAYLGQVENALFLENEFNDEGNLRMRGKNAILNVGKAMDAENAL